MGCEDERNKGRGGFSLQFTKMTNSIMYKGEAGVIHLLSQEQETLGSIEATQDSPAFMTIFWTNDMLKKATRHMTQVELAKWN